MNKQFLLLTFALAGTLTSPALALGRKKTTDSYESAKTERKLSRVEFWTTVVTALKKSGYDEESPEIRHARKYLHRAETVSKAFGHHKAPRKRSTRRKEGTETEATHTKTTKRSGKSAGA